MRDFVKFNRGMLRSSLPPIMWLTSLVAAIMTGLRSQVAVARMVVASAWYDSVGQPFGLWVRGGTCLNGLSLVMGFADVVQYAAGDRKELVEGI